MKGTGNHPTGRVREHNARFSRVALRALNGWLKSHPDNPYPTESEKATLGRVTGLEIGQINVWFANARRRGKHFASISLPQSSTRPNATYPVDLDVPSTICDKELSDVLVATVPCAQHHVSIDFNSALDLATRIYQCTFCPDTFKTKYDWTRHEISLHFPLRRFICCPFQPIIEDLATKAKTCAYCNASEPTMEHIEAHNHSYCQERDPETRTFFRKDHLRQHLQSVHDCHLLPHMDAWLLEAVFVNSRCGFCGKRFTVWKERNDHIGNHYKDGLTMNQWRGCRGLDAEVSAEVTAAMPPFLVGVQRSTTQSVSALPHKNVKASNHTDQFATLVSSCEILAVQLHAFTKKLATEHFVVTDDMLQRHARLVVYGSSESRLLTAADNPEWLDLFKKAYSLDIIPDSIGGEAKTIPDDLEVYHDLGLRIPPSLRKQRQQALIAMFLNDEPPLKNYRRFSSLPVPMERALHFETIAGPWPDAGVLGQMIVTRDWMLHGAVETQLRRPLRFAMELEDDTRIDDDERSLVVAPPEC